MRSTRGEEAVVIEGFVKRDATLGRRGMVVYLSPWWHGAAHVVDAPLRLRLPGRDAVAGAELARGTSVRLACTHLEAPRVGASWWAATAAGDVHAPGWGRTLAAGSAAEDPSTTAHVPGPILVLDRFFGRLTFEPRSNLFRGKRRGYRHAYEVLIDRSSTAHDRSRDHLDVERARAVVRVLELELTTIHEDVAGHARAIYCDKWRGARGRLTSEKVAARIALSSARVSPAGQVSLCFSEDDLFYGHWLEARLDPNLCVQTVEVAGLQKVS